MFKKRRFFVTIIFCFIAVFPRNAAETHLKRPAAWAQPITIEGAPNLYKVNDNLYRSAQPTALGMKNLETFGIKTVLSLRSFHSDYKKIRGTRLKYEHIYMKTWHPEEEDIIKFLQITNNPQLTPVIVHCQHGSDRTGVMCAIYRIIVQGWSKEQALAEMSSGEFGLHAIWKNLSPWIQKLDIEKIRKEAGIKNPA